jgi:hypothetical protein
LWQGRKRDAFVPWRDRFGSNTQEPSIMWFAAATIAKRSFATITIEKGI